MLMCVCLRILASSRIPRSGSWKTDPSFLRGFCHNEVGDPTQPPVLVNVWKTSVGKLIRENVPVMYRFWKGKKHEEKYIVPDSIKQNLWDTLMAKFELPRDCNMGLVKSRTLINLSLSFRSFKRRMSSQYGQKDKMSDWDKYPLLKP